MEAAWTLGRTQPGVAGLLPCCGWKNSGAIPPLEPVDRTPSCRLSEFPCESSLHHRIRTRPQQCRRGGTPQDGRGGADPLTPHIGVNARGCPCGIWTRGPEKPGLAVRRCPSHSSREEGPEKPAEEQVNFERAPEGSPCLLTLALSWHSATGLLIAALPLQTGKNPGWFWITRQSQRAGFFTLTIALVQSVVPGQAPASKPPATLCFVMPA